LSRLRLPHLLDRAADLGQGGFLGWQSVFLQVPDHSLGNEVVEPSHGLRVVREMLASQFGHFAFSE
jgi:hypothetical protein